MTKYKARIVVDTYVIIETSPNTSMDKKEQMAKRTLGNSILNLIISGVEVTEMVCLATTPLCPSCASENTVLNSAGLFKCISCDTIFVGEGKV